MDVEKNSLFTFPQDREAVQILAIASAMEGAWLAVQQRKVLDGTDINTFAKKAAKGYLTLQAAGKQGTNDTLAFNTIFTSIMKMAYPAMLILLSCSPDLHDLLAALPESSSAFHTAFHGAAMHNLHLLAATDTPFLLTWPGLAQKEVV